MTATRRETRLIGFFLAEVVTTIVVCLERRKQCYLYEVPFTFLGADSSRHPFSDICSWKTDSMIVFYSVSGLSIVLGSAWLCGEGKSEFK